MPCDNNTHRGAATTSPWAGLSPSLYGEEGGLNSFRLGLPSLSLSQMSTAMYSGEEDYD